MEAISLKKRSINRNEAIDKFWKITHLGEGKTGDLERHSSIRKNLKIAEKRKKRNSFFNSITTIWGYVLNKLHIR
ncbi:MAG: hypothetical protein A2W90_04965 [Bacteroidetes bacterium GWF2_42_66]|nr:MAG: hypothetical protein A2W89_21185 [Bacteroidetes bacterium GWE2_42_39]OFY40836.1 MAG: hypothetical protein A2W90_04965 [Bacteroidetes bacterium GWF2_42_66]HBL75857.1 hypothetical protein [Prolixibacteraceae bacterium]HCU63106.1 hypothetical protein [Prolixibacteraceae bacterium]